MKTCNNEKHTVARQDIVMGARAFFFCCNAVGYLYGVLSGYDSIGHVQKVDTD